MPMRVNLPKGCASSRGVSDIRHITSQGGSLAHHTNRLYMLNVRRESLMNKRRSLGVRLKEIGGQLEGIEADIRATEEQYRKLKRNRSGQKGTEEGSVKGRRDGHKGKAMLLKF